MTNQTFADEAAFSAFSERELQTIQELLARKGQQYSNTSRRELAWSNYAEMAAVMHSSPQEEIMHAMLKHVWVCAQWSRGQNSAPDIDERLNDIIVFSLLLKFIKRQLMDQPVLPTPTTKPLKSGNGRRARKRKG